MNYMDQTWKQELKYFAQVSIKMLQNLKISLTPARVEPVQFQQLFLMFELSIILL